MSRKRKRAQQTYGKRHRNSNPFPHHPSSPSPLKMSWFPDSNNMDTSQNPPPPPKKPTSQRAATMPADPDPEKVRMMVEFTGIPEGEAIRWLRVKQGNVEAAVNAMYGEESLSKLEEGTQWNEGLMSADREGVQNDNLNKLQPFTGSAAATRPNSPAPSQRSLQPTNQADADEQMARAIAASQQETGVVGPGGGQVFGPATREHYDQNQWAMVPTAAGTWGEAIEIVPDLAVEHRICGVGEPRMLKHLPGGDYTPNLLTICAAIDGAQEAMLMREHVQADYGQDGEWWKGHAITRPKIVHVGDGTAAEPEADQQDELLAETQRLMAFLTASSRSYASVGALLATDVLKRTSVQTTRSQTVLELFLQNWAVAASSKSDVDGEKTRLFNTTVGTNAPEGMDTPDMSLINMHVTLGEGEKADLYELLDGLLWDTDADPTAISDNYIEEPAEVLVMRVYQANPAMAQQLRVDVPPELYVDKYLKDNIAATRATRMRMSSAKKRIEKIEKLEKKLKYWKHPKKNENIEATTLLEHTRDHFNGQNRIKAAKLDKTNTAATEDETAARPPYYDEIAEKLDKVLASINHKLEVLKEEKEKTRKAISDMSKSPPPGLETDQLKHRYTLRGVATEPHITYVLCPIDPETDRETLDDEATPAGMRWWRMEYKVNSDSGVQLTKSRVGDYDVIRAVELEHSSALLVYASDVATTPPSELRSLPQALQDFIDRDNELLATELQADPQQPPPAYGSSFDLTDVPRESIERASLDSTRAEGNVSDTEDQGLPRYGDDAFYNHQQFGLGPDIKQGYRMDEDVDDGPVHEIRLDDNEDGGEVGTEMVERAGGRGGLGGLTREEARKMDEEAGW